MKIILDAPYRRNLTLTMHDREQTDRAPTKKSEECFDASTRETGNGEMTRERTVTSCRWWRQCDVLYFLHNAQNKSHLGCQLLEICG